MPEQHLGYRIYRDDSGICRFADRVLDGAMVWVRDGQEIGELTADFLATQPDLADRPVPAPAIAADWAAFRLRMPTCAAYLRIASATPQTQVLNSVLIELLGKVGADPGEYTAAVFAVWNQIAALAEPIEAEIAAINAIARSCNMPFCLDGDGRMEVN